MNGSEYDTKPGIYETAVAYGKLNNERAGLRTAEDVIGPDGLRQRRKEYGRCGACAFFTRPDHCRTVEGPVQPDTVCDWLQIRGGELEELAKERLPGQSQAFAEPEALAWALMTRRGVGGAGFRVIGFTIATDAPLFLCEDGAAPPHRFSLSLDRLVNRLAVENGWSPEEIDELVREGKAMDFKPPINVREAEEMYGAGQVDRATLEGLRREEKAKSA